MYCPRRVTHYQYASVFMYTIMRGFNKIELKIIKSKPRDPVSVRLQNHMLIIHDLTLNLVFIIFRDQVD